MAIQYVGGTSLAFDGRTTSTTIPLTGLTGGIASAPATGDVIIVAYAVSASGQVNIVVGTAGYNQFSRVFSDDTYDTVLAIYGKVVGSTPDTSVALSQTYSSGNAGTVSVLVFRGVDTSNALDTAVAVSSGINGIIATSPEITPTTQGAVAIVVAAGAGTQNYMPAPYEVGGLSNLVSIASPDTRAVVLATGTVNWPGSGSILSRQFTTTTGFENASSWASAAVALRPAPGGGPVPVSLTPASSGSTTNSTAPSVVFTEGSGVPFVAPGAGRHTVDSTSPNMSAELPPAVSSLTYGSVKADPANTGYYIFDDMDFGAPQADRYVVAAIAWRTAGTTNDIASVYIGGVEAALVQKARNTNGGQGTSSCDLYIAAVPEGTSGQVQVLLTQGAVRCGVATYRLTGLASPVAAQTGFGDQGLSTNNASLTTTAPSHVIGVSFNANGSCVFSSAHADVPAGRLDVETQNGSSSTTWTGLTEDSDILLENTNGLYGALVIAAWPIQTGVAALSITPSNGLHGLTSTAPNIGSSSTTIAPANATQTVTSSSASLASKSTILPNNSAHSVISTSPTFAAKSAISPVSSVHSVLSSQPSTTAVDPVLTFDIYVGPINALDAVFLGPGKLPSLYVGPRAATPPEPELGWAVLAGKTLHVDGDSVAKGLNANSSNTDVDRNYAWPKQLADAIGATITNVSEGSRTLAPHTQNPNTNNIYYSIVTAGLGVGVNKKDAILIAGVGNDALSGPSYSSPAQVTDHYRRIIARLLADGYTRETIIVCGMYYVVNAGLSSRGITRAYWETFNVAIRAIATEFGVPFVDLYSIVPGAGDVSFDDLHPTRQGHTNIAIAVRNMPLTMDTRPGVSGLSASGRAGYLIGEWLPFPGATSYDVRVINSTNWSVVKTLTTTDTTLETPSSSGSYYLEVRADTPDGKTPWEQTSAAGVVPA